MNINKDFVTNEGKPFVVAVMPASHPSLESGKAWLEVIRQAFKETHNIDFVPGFLPREFHDPKAFSFKHPDIDIKPTNTPTWKIIWEAYASV